MFWKKKKYNYVLDYEIPLLTPVDNLSFIVFDTEATGLEVGAGDRLIEIGAVHVENLQVTASTFHSYINPERDIPRTIIELTGITEEQVQGAVLAEEGIVQFLDFVEEHQSCSLVGHCVGFDTLIIEQELKRQQAVCNKPRVIDTLDLLRLLNICKQGRDLEDYASEFGITIEARHTALGDATATAELLCQLLKRLKRRYRTWGELLFAVESRQRAAGMY
ncbi:3'-5' exonuclease [Desulfuribacillus alkaliarsenatis]|uniref:Exonuclease domain-containing protein n=1 Tax=Desulfuribacillus alkaliarsenatis TaxID=766136 RepID=A0A1E5FZ59_9FIRM|nr:3'-5' exonuclease [Desulfuribacillus alkaliarsenatis]OEF95864.1 hypothetical protein BHF68_10740 [Desulfuribacillus alkaliarsenatis]